MNNTQSKENKTVPQKNNLLIRRSIRRMYPAAFASSLTMSIYFLIDSMLAGCFISRESIAAIAIGMPLHTLQRSIVLIFGEGMILKMATCIGRGDNENNNKFYSLGRLSQAILSILFCIITLIFAEKLVVLCGAREDTLELTSRYIRFYSPFIFCSCFAATDNRLLFLYGYPGSSFKLSFVKVVANIVFSVLLVKFTNLGIAGLALGSVLAEGLSIIGSTIIISKKKLGLAFKLYRFKLKEIWDLIRLGLPSSCDTLVDSFVSGIVNNILVTTLGTISISIYSVTNGIVRLASISSSSAAKTVTPLFGLLFGARDKNGIKRSFVEGFFLGLLSTVVWGGIIILLLPLLLKFYGMETPDVASIIRPGVYIGVAFVVIITLNQMCASLFESCERFIMALAFSIVADSIFFPLLLPSMIAAWGYTALWVGKGLSIILFFTLYYVTMCVLKRTVKPSLDSLLQLNSDLRENAPKVRHLHSCKQRKCTRNFPGHTRIPRQLWLKWTYCIYGSALY